MSTPVEGVDGAPLYGGTRGVKRSVQGNPTSVPRNAPAFRGVRSTPGDRVRPPAIEAKNRDDRGTNVTIPYSRLVPWDTLKNVGRISPGDAVFTSRMRVGGPHYAPTAAPTRIVGVDCMNRHLGNTSDPSAPDSSKWVPGLNVLLGSDVSVPSAGVGDAACDNWRECSMLRGWCLDGVVLSNDEPGVYHGSGKNDAQLFNIAVQGLATVNNGFCDFRGNPIHTDRSRLMGSGGTRAVADYGGSYDYGAANDPFYHKYPMQMFDRKVRVMSELFVGLVATKRLITDELRARWKESPDVSAKDREALNPELDALTGQPKLVSGTDLEVYKVNAFYTYRYVYFSTRALWDYASDLVDDGLARTNPYTGMNFPTEDGVGWRNESSQRHGSHPTGHPADGGVDAFSTMSRADFQGLVGAWKVGKVFDVAARRREVHSSGPIDTSEALTVNVNIEWYDWRKLRHLAEDPTIGHMNSGALSWGYKMHVSGSAEMVTYDRSDWRESVPDAVFNWPSEYQPKNADEPYRYDGSSFEARGDVRGQGVATTLARIYNTDGTVGEIAPGARATDRVQGYSGTPGVTLVGGVEDPGHDPPYLDAVDYFGDETKFGKMRDAYERRVTYEKAYRKWLGEGGLAVGKTRSGAPLGETARMTALRRLLRGSGSATTTQIAEVITFFRDSGLGFNASSPDLSLSRFQTAMLEDTANKIEGGEWVNVVLKTLAPALTKAWSSSYTRYVGTDPTTRSAIAGSPFAVALARNRLRGMLETLFNDIQLLYRRTRGGRTTVDRVVTQEEMEFYMNPVNSKGAPLTVEDLFESAGQRLRSAFGATERPPAAETALDGRKRIDPKEPNVSLLISSRAPGTSNLGQMQVEPAGAPRPTQGSVAAAVTAAAAAAAPADAAAAGVGLAVDAQPPAAAADGASALAADAPAPAKRARRASGAAQGSADVFASIFGGSGRTSAGTAAGASAASATAGDGGSEPASPAVSDQGSVTGASATGAASKSQRSVRRRGQGL